MSITQPDKALTRRKFLQTAAAAAGSLLAACSSAPPATVSGTAAPAGAEAATTAPTTAAATAAAPAPAAATAAPAATSAAADATSVTAATTAGSVSSDWLHAADVSQMPPTSIRYWYYESPERTALGKRQVNTFAKIFPNIKVEGRTAPPAVDNEQLLAFIKAGTNSHVHQSVCNEDTWYIDHKLLQPLEDLPGFKEIWDRLAPELNYTWKDGHVYSLSWYSGPMAMYYNKKMVTEAGLDPAKPPTTYSEYLKWGAALTKDKNGDGKPDQWFLAIPVGEEWWWYEFVFYPFYIAATGSNQLFDKEGKKALFNTPEGLKPYKLFDELFKKGYTTRESFQANPFLNGIVAATNSLPELLPQIKQFAPKDFEFIVGPIPKPDDAKHPGNPTYNFVRNFALFYEQQKQGDEAVRTTRAAWEFMKYLLSPEEMAADFTVSGDFPPVKDLTTNALYKETLDQIGPVAKWLVDYAKQSQIYDMNSLYESESMALLQDSWKKVALGKATPEQAIADAEQAVNKLLVAGPNK